MKTSHLLRLFSITSTLLCAVLSGGVQAQNVQTPQAVVPGKGQKWATTWAAAAQAFYVGDPSTKAAIPSPTTDGANEQTLRMIVKPDLWGNSMRFRFSNTYGNKPVTFARVTVGLQNYGANILHGTMTPITFNGGFVSVTIPVGQEIFSDPVTLAFVAGPDDPSVSGRNLAVSFYVQGTSGLITDHLTTFTSHYLTGPGTGDHTQEENDASYAYTTGGPSGPLFFLDAVDVVALSTTSVICALGDSITDSTFMTFNGHDSWPDQLSRRLHAAYGNTVSVVNEGIGGNLVTNQAGNSFSNQAAVTRLDRDVLGLSGLNHVVWLEGINDLGNGVSADEVIAGYQNVVGRLHNAGVDVTGATVLSSLNPSRTSYGTEAINTQRQQLNKYVRTSRLFDHVADMDAATVDAGTGYLQPQLATHGFINPVPDYLHPGRAGFQAMALTIDLNPLAPAGTQ